MATRAYITQLQFSKKYFLDNPARDKKEYRLIGEKRDAAFHLRVLL